MSEHILLGDEALALGAIDSGISAAYAYPGTPSTEILEYVIDYSERTGSPIASWTSNEKTALEEGLGVSYVGKRVLVCMKHVGLNVAADPFINSALLEIQGGLVLAVADDPGMHSSQNEQDSRFYADFAKIISLEPRNQQQAYDMCREAFDLSEKHHIPVLVRLTTRLSHSRALVNSREKRKENPIKKAPDKKAWMLLPAFARKRYDSLLEKQEEFAAYSESSPHNQLFLNPVFKDFAVITCGLGRNYYEENVEDLAQRPSHLHISAYPLPIKKIRKLAELNDRIVVIEEGYPFLETKLRGILETGKTIQGKLDGSLPASGELNPDLVRPGLGLKEKESLGSPPAMDLPKRPPQLCKGCPHIDSFNAINEALNDQREKIVTADIGCYALGALPPYDAVETIVCMGASISLAKGAAEVGYKNVVAVIGDSTFLHSGLTPLVDAVASNSSITVIILDNETVAMTGSQPTILPSSRLRKVVEGIGVDPDHVVEIRAEPKQREENIKAIRKEVAYEGLSVIISCRECLEAFRRRRKKERA